jgi:hypothetical protein
LAESTVVVDEEAMCDPMAALWQCGGCQVLFAASDVLTWIADQRVARPGQRRQVG